MNTFIRGLVLLLALTFSQYGLAITPIQDNNRLVGFNNVPVGKHHYNLRFVEGSLIDVPHVGTPNSMISLAQAKLASKALVEAMGQAGVPWVSAKLCENASTYWAITAYEINYLRDFSDVSVVVAKFQVGGNSQLMSNTIKYIRTTYDVDDDVSAHKCQFYVDWIRSDLVSNHL